MGCYRWHFPVYEIRPPSDGPGGHGNVVLQLYGTCPSLSRVLQEPQGRSGGWSLAVGDCGGVNHTSLWRRKQGNASARGGRTRAKRECQRSRGLGCPVQPKAVGLNTLVNALPFSQEAREGFTKRGGTALETPSAIWQGKPFLFFFFPLGGVKEGLRHWCTMGCTEPTLQKIPLRIPNCSSFSFPTSHLVKPGA